MARSISAFEPLDTDTITMTEAIPIMIPSMVRKLRRAFNLSATSAILIVFQIPTIPGLSVLSHRIVDNTTIPEHQLAVGFIRNLHVMCNDNNRDSGFV